jgi:hypothetical protein
MLALSILVLLDLVVYLHQRIATITTLALRTLVQLELVSTQLYQAIVSLVTLLLASGLMFAILRLALTTLALSPLSAVTITMLALLILAATLPQLLSVSTPPRVVITPIFALLNSAMLLLEAVTCFPRTVTMETFAQTMAAL